MTSVRLWDQLVNLPKQREFQWLVAGILSWFLWRPIRVTINHWRLHRRQRKYPQLVLCRVDKAPSYGQRRSPATIGRILRNFLLAMLHSLVTFLLVLPLKCLQFVIELWTSHKPDPQPTSTAYLSEPSSTPTQPPKRTSPPLSVLRRAGASSSVHSRVEFAEHSNGHIRTERRYYLPHAQPSQSIQPPNTPSPPSVHSKRTEAETIFLTPEWPSSRPNTKRQFVPTQKLPISQNPTIRRDDTQAVALIHSSTPNRLLAQTPLSEQMRKRRLDEHMDQLSAKRSSLAGRVTLAGTQARIIGSRRTFLNKRDLEAREDRILKDLNTKRIKTKNDTNDIDTTPSASFKSPLLPFQQATVDSSSVLGSTANGTPSFSFQAPSTGADTTRATSTESADSQKGLSLGASSTFTEPTKEKDATDTGPIALSAGFSFGTSSNPSETKPLPSFNIPASAPSSEKGPVLETNSSTVAQSAAAPTFQFGAASQSSSSDAPATTTSTGFSFGSTSADTGSSTNVSVGPAFQFGAPSPAPSSKEPTPGPGFSFGSASTTAPAPAFQFGAAAPAPEAQAPGTSFSFGMASTTKSEASAPSFQFGTKDPGIASGAPPAGSGFSFGNSSSATSGPTPVTGVPFGMAQESAIPAFNFDSTSTMIPTGAGSAVGGGGASARRRAKAKAGRRR